MALSGRDLSKPCKINEEPSRDNSATFLMHLVTGVATAAHSRDIDLAGDGVTDDTPRELGEGERKKNRKRSAAAL